MDWAKLSETSHYQTALAVKQSLDEQNIADATQGIEELIEALGRSDKRALRSQLTRLMAHILKWKIQPQQRSRSWLATITDARIEIADLLEDELSLKNSIPELWPKCFNAAKRLARDETGIEPAISMLSEKQVFEEEYSL
ncbi:MAG: DUF29 domain-containing protein [Chloroflexi bacterium]|nr:DUF29 domain-containing protein [Chloroflexota bacterium]